MSECIQLTTSKLDTNTYIVINGDGGFVIDPGGDAEKIISVFQNRGAKLQAILLTHAHFDHIGGVAELQRLATKNNCTLDEKSKDGDDAKIKIQSNQDNGASECESPKIFVHKDDRDKISSFKNLGFAMGVKVEKFSPDILLAGGEELSICGLKIKVIHTPGHSKGGVCYVCEDRIFVGDTVFYGSYGRVDFYDGSFAQIKNSIINKLFRIQGDYLLCPGHGGATTLEFERNHNSVLWDCQTPSIVD